MEAILKRDRLIIIAALASLMLLAWGYMIAEAREMSVSGVCCCAGMKMSGPDMNAWSPATLVPLFLMWAEMMVAMMVPSAAPMLLTFASVQRKRREQSRPFVPTGIFLLGYLIVWTGFSAVAAAVQWCLHAEALLSPAMVSTSPILGGTLLIAAGIFQWAPLKNSCLARCRSPLGFLLCDWREGKLGALFMGVSHGVHCIGCCWILMLLLFVVGVMNIWWIAALTVFVLVEKTLPRTMPLGKAAGVLLAVWGCWVMIRS